MKEQKQVYMENSIEKLNALLVQQTAELAFKNRELEIEAALERVRAKTMAMQKSDELREVVFELFNQMYPFGIGKWGCGVCLADETNNAFDVFFSTPSEPVLPENYKVPTLDNPVQEKYWLTYKCQLANCVIELADDAKTEYDKWLFRETGFGRLPDIVKEAISSVHYVQFSITAMKYGVIEAIDVEPISDKNLEILQRFAKVFEQTYTRFLDLKKAETQAQEAIKRASVDRVRAEIASMRTASDLDRITPIIWKELITLGVPILRCGIFIMDEQQEKIHSFLSTLDGKSIAAFHLSYHTPGKITELKEYWHKKESHLEHWDETAFAAWNNTLVQSSAISPDEKYLSEGYPPNLYLHFLPFLQGILYVGNAIPLNEYELHLVQDLADAFSTAYARYEDFNKLESAKTQIEKALFDLKQAQAQLVQAEKMASLGELTAGIAHEIQNPLNFVNNFSEVNTELINDLEQEVDKGNLEEVKAIAKDIKDNEQKINHHGKRADAIVKGMLQHSRTSSGQQELTDINALCDEYLKLAYHGFRAKDKLFTAEYKTDFDRKLPKIIVVPQDIGRVLLNLINNAFYAVQVKTQNSASPQQKQPHYNPTVMVSTNYIGNHVEICVKDNGPGIPLEIKDKIFQPFFTTKPTGQGTGLGLSLAYDIVKAHGGELKVESMEGEGSEFIIILPITKNENNG